MSLLSTHMVATWLVHLWVQALGSVSRSCRKLPGSLSCFVFHSRWEFSFNHSLLPPKFNDYFSLNKQVHGYATRYANDFHLPFCRTNLRKFSVSLQRPTYYNSLENDIKESYSLNSFKTKLKKKLCELLALKIL